MLACGELAQRLPRQDRRSCTEFWFSLGGWLIQSGLRWGAPNLEFSNQNRNTIPADGCAAWVTLFVFRLLIPKSGAL